MDAPSRLEKLVSKRDDCKGALDKAQAALNKYLVDNCPVRPGDIIQDIDQTVFRVYRVIVKTVESPDRRLLDRIMIEFQKRRADGAGMSWQRTVINTAALTERVLAGETKTIKRG